jgi:hypothetical protein
LLDRSFLLLLLPRDFSAVRGAAALPRDTLHPPRDARFPAEAALRIPEECPDLLVDIDCLPLAELLGAPLKKM